jgi:hypothetical protein
MGSNIEGSLLIYPAREIRSINVRYSNGNFLTFSDAYRSGAEKLIIPFGTSLLFPGKFIRIVDFETDSGITPHTSRIEVAKNALNGIPMLIFESAFEYYSDSFVHQNLMLVVRENNVQLNSCRRLPSNLLDYQIILLHGAGSTALLESERDAFHSYVLEGRRLIIMADLFFDDSAMKANHFTETYGILLEDREYDEIRCDQRHIKGHAFTRDVRKLRWVRAAPMVVSNAGELVVLNPENSQEGFVACSGPDRNVIVIGVSSLERMLCVGWPFENAQLFANLVGNLQE